MNKLFIVLLAVCLVSVHAFVKRDAPEATKTDSLGGVQQKFEDTFKDINEQIKQAFDPEKIKKAFNEGVDAISKAVSDIQGKKEAPKA